jgi:hypothetical protein
MKLSKKTKILTGLNTAYLIIIGIEEAKIIELLPFEDSIKHSIKTSTLALVGILNVVISQMKLK